MFINIEVTRKVRENSLFIAPKAVTFIFNALMIRGIFNHYPFNLIKIKWIYAATKIISIGLIALGAGLDHNLKNYGGILSWIMKSLWELEVEKLLCIQPLKIPYIIKFLKKVIRFSS